MEEKKELPICAKCGEYHPRCSGHKKAKNSPDGKIHPCMRWPLKTGGTGCKIHGGGRKNAGMKNGNFKHGRYSDFLPRQLDERIRALKKAREGSDYLSIRDHIDIVEARMSQIMERLETSDSKQTWIDVGKARLDIREGIKTADMKRVTAALKILDDLSLKGTKEYRSWDELVKLQKHFNELIASERRKMMEDRFMVSLEEVQLIFSFIGHAVNEKVKDAQTRLELAKEIQVISERAGFEIA